MNRATVYRRSRLLHIGFVVYPLESIRDRELPLYNILLVFKYILVILKDVMAEEVIYKS